MKDRENRLSEEIFADRATELNEEDLGRVSGGKTLGESLAETVQKGISDIQAVKPVLISKRKTERHNA